MRMGEEVYHYGSVERSIFETRLMLKMLKRERFRIVIYVLCSGSRCP